MNKRNFQSLCSNYTDCRRYPCHCRVLHWRRKGEQRKIAFCFCGRPRCCDNDCFRGNKSPKRSVKMQMLLLKSSSDNRNIQKVVARIKKPSTLSSSPPCAMSQSIIVILIPFSTLNRYFLSGKDVKKLAFPNIFFGIHYS